MRCYSSYYILTLIVQLIHQPTYALNKVTFMTSVNSYTFQLHVPCSGNILEEGVQASLTIALPILEL